MSRIQLQRTRILISLLTLALLSWAGSTLALPQDRILIVEASFIEGLADWHGEVEETHSTLFDFDEGSGASVADTSGNGNGGAIGAATWTTSGKYGNALSFNGTSAMVANHLAAVVLDTPGMVSAETLFETDPERGTLLVDLQGTFRGSDLRERRIQHERVLVRTGGSVNET